MSNSHSFGDEVKRQRRVLDLTQTALAKQIGCAPVTIKKIEAGVLRPSHQIATLLARALHVAEEHHGSFVQFARLRPVSQAQPFRRNVELLPIWIPAPTTSLIGRTDEQAALVGVLARPDVRLVTLLGPGGIGKTRLVLAVAEQLTALHHSVVFVDLVPIEQPEHVGMTIARALGVAHATSDDVLAQIVAHLRNKSVVLVIDNVEHVVNEAPLIAQILEGSPGVRVLATSRLALRLAGEHIYTVPPLASTTPASPAVQLFVERAQAARPTFGLSHHNTAAIVELCIRLDGLPLAIELAAAQIKLYSPAELLLQLQHSNRSSLLQNRNRDATARQQSYQATLIWSYQLLRPAEQTLFARLGVFTGGWTLAMAEDVCSEEGSDDEYAVEVVHEGLSTLIDHSLVQSIEAHDGSTRFVMLETIRAFAAQLLASNGEHAALVRRHAACLAAFAKAAAQGLSEHQQQWWLDRLDVELGNIRTALKWSITTGGNLERGQFMATDLRYYWYMRGWAEGRTWLTHCLEHAQAEQNASAHARVLHVASEMAINAGEDLDQAIERATTALTTFHTLGDTVRAARVRSNLGWAAIRQHNLTDAANILAQAHAEAVMTSDPFTQGDVLCNMAELATAEQNYDAALQCYRQACLLFTSIGDQAAAAGCYHSASFAAAEKGDYHHAITLLTNCLPIRDALRDMLGTVYVRMHLGDNCLAVGEPTHAASWYREALKRATEYGLDEAERTARWRQSYALLQDGSDVEAGNELMAVLRECHFADDITGAYACLDGLALLWSRHGEAKRAAQTWGALTSVSWHPSGTRWTVIAGEIERAIATTCITLGNVVFEDVWNQGQQVLRAELVAEVIEHAFIPVK